jgi:hypothetical protein
LTHPNWPLSVEGRRRLVERCARRQETSSPELNRCAATASGPRQGSYSELGQKDIAVSRRTVSRILAQLQPNRRKFIDPSGETNREPQKIISFRPGHMAHIDVKKAARIPDGGGWRAHGKNSQRARAVARTKTCGTRTGHA